MNEQESWYTHEIRKILCKERYSTTSHHYFFELKEAKNGSKYIVIDQRKKVGSEFVSSKIRLFADEMLEFQRILNKFIHLAVLKQPSPGVSVSSQVLSPSFQLPSNERYQLASQPVIGMLRKATSQVQRWWNHSQPNSSQASSDLQPGFFQKLITTENWQEFEEYTYYLLKLLGIHTLYHFLGERQAGKADGFLKLGNVAVLYDCTLRRDNIEREKHEQINNYCHRLQQGYIELSETTIEEFYQHHKQVWIISRGTTRHLRLMNMIEVKEIGITDIMELYQERLTSKMNDQALEMRIRNL
ncbi:hypothetical protein QUF80_21605 [Desulfococcaceae bacterium HSG8]|nr:hypothetical protein [Desulfococcaceae bacterium HSG8]